MSLTGDMIVTRLAQLALPDAEGDALVMLAEAYRDLLRMPQGGVRARNQAVLASLRDGIAAELGMTAETVQNAFEDAAA